ELGEMGEPQGAELDEPMVAPAIEELAEPMVEAEEQTAASVIDMEEDLAARFGEDDDSEGFDEEEVWEVNEEWLMAPTTPPPMLAVQSPSVYEVGGPSTAVAEGPSFPLPAPGLPVPPSMIEDLSTRLGNLEYKHGQLVKKVIQVSDAEVATGVTIGEIGPRVFAIEGQTVAQRDEAIAELTQQLQALQAAMQQKDSQIQQLQTTFTEMGSQESTLMQCILGMDRRLAKLLCMHIMYLGLVAVDGSDGTKRGYQGLCLGEIVS
ncbi:hypothetical protein Tco_0834574, partial [Tanacetum coccineum]